MRLALVFLSLGWMACAAKGSIMKDVCEAPEPPERPGGACTWWVTEGGAECVVETDFEVRHRTPGTKDEIEGARGYDKKKWRCGEKREVCGTEVECTCPFPATPDGGAHPDGGS